MRRWQFDDGPDDSWTWSCVDSQTGHVIIRSGRTFGSLRECVLDAVKQRVQEHQRELERLH